MVEIKCLVCGKAIHIPGFIDASNYDGQVACPECGSLLEVRLVGNKVRKYRVVERASEKGTVNTAAPAGSSPPARSRLSQPAAAARLDVEEVARYNPLRDFLATYRASQLHLAFEQIENMVGSRLETGAYTFRSWWDNDRSHPQALAWLEAGWEVDDVIFEQQEVVLRRLAQP